MRVLSILSLFVLAGCAATAKDLQAMSPAEVCYRSMTDTSEKAMAQAEVQRRSINCQDHMAEIKKINELEQRTNRMGEGVGDATPKAKTGTSSGGMGRGY
jgi:hypothetical protein